MNRKNISFFLPAFLIVAAVPAAAEIKAVNPYQIKRLAFQGLILKELIDHG